MVVGEGDLLIMSSEEPSQLNGRGMWLPTTLRTWEGNEDTHTPTISMSLCRQSRTLLNNNFHRAGSQSNMLTLDKRISASSDQLDRVRGKYFYVHSKSLIFGVHYITTAVVVCIYLISVCVITLDKLLLCDIILVVCYRNYP